MPEPRVINLFTDRSHYRPEHHRFLLHPLRPVWNAAAVEPSDVYAVDGVPLFALTDDIDRADMCVLPMTWNYYVNQRRVPEARSLAATARAHGKLLLIMAAGDQEPVVPIENAVVVHPGPNRSIRRQAAYTFAEPSFIPDYREMYWGGRAEYRNKGPRPVVGFCGYGAMARHKAALYAARNLLHQVEYRLGRSAVVPEPVRPAVTLRWRALKALAASPQIAANFIIRTQYRAGLRTQDECKDPFHKTKVEFVQNMRDSDYTVCVRGGGNFSVRLYETLCVGRIPIFVNTDCVLPYHFAIDWKSYCCWIEQGEVKHIAEKVADFHASLSNGEFVDRQQACRRLWEERLSPRGFFHHFADHLRHIERQGAPVSSAEHLLASTSGAPPVSAAR